jgi:gamma-glutamyltranspeptidase/glutathione hydrolase
MIGSLQDGGNSMANQRERPASLPGAVPGSESLEGVNAPRRGPVFGSRYAVATDHPYASLAAMNVMQRGGNAADAAIAASAVNVVTKPHRTQLGGDAFMLVWRRGPNVVECLNAGGRAPLKATLDRFTDGIPSTGALASTVPGLVDAWMELHKTYATLSLETLFRPAIELAEQGFPASMRLAQAMTSVVRFDNPAMRRTFLVDGQRPYAEGETFRQPELAETLRRLADHGEREGFYEGETAALIARGMREADGLIDEADFELPAAHWHEPLKTTYAGCEVYEQALPSQGIILLEALNIAEHFPLRDWGLGSADATHVLIEATKLAFADSRRYSADPEVEAVPAEMLLSNEYARERAGLIDLRRAQSSSVPVATSDTTEFVVADGDLAIAFIQSVFAAWGSRFVIPGTGILMNNRLRGFSTDPAHPNHLAPGKRTVHTLNTFLAIRDGQLAVGGGTPGADFQVQSNLQTIVATQDWGLDLQSAIDMPRWVTIGGGQVALESRFDPALIADLASRGHMTRVVAPWDATLSRNQVMQSLPGGGWAVASDLRGEGVALAI